MLNEIHKDPHSQRRVIAYITHISMVLIGLCEVVSEDTKTGLLLSAADNDMAIICISMAFVVYIYRSAT